LAGFGRLWPALAGFGRLWPITTFNKPSPSKLAADGGEFKLWLWPQNYYYYIIIYLKYP